MLKLLQELGDFAHLKLQSIKIKDMVKTVCAQSCTDPYKITPVLKMSLSSEAPQHTKFETSRSRSLRESYPKSL